MYFFKNNVSMKKTLNTLILIFISLFIVGCSANGKAEENERKSEDVVDKNEQAIRAVIEHEFNGPDEKYKTLWKAMEKGQNADMDSEEYEAFLESPEYQELMSYSEETYSPYFTANGYDNFINATPAFQYIMADQDYELNTSNIEIDQSENGTTLYDFDFQVEYKDENGESEQYNFSGNAIVPEEGKIGKIEYSDEDGLLQELRNNE